MANSRVLLLVALTVGGCRLFTPTESPRSGMEALIRDSERQAKESLALWQQAEVDAKQSLVDLQVVIDKIKAYEARSKAADAEREAYAAAMAEAREIAAACTGTPERLVAVHAVLLEYVAEPRRDAAIEGLEPCRKRAAKPKSKAERARADAAMRKDVALALERSFDEQRPEHRGHLIAAVRGDVLVVSAPKLSGWDAEQSQAQVEQWCATVPNFTAIELKDPAGTFRCRTAEQPGDHAARMLREGGLAEPWTPAPAGQKNPSPQSGAAEIAEMEALGKELKLAEARAEEAAGLLEAYAERVEVTTANYEEAVKLAADYDAGRKLTAD